MVDKNIYIVQGEINTVVGAIKRNARWNTHTHLVSLLESVRSICVTKNLETVSFNKIKSPQTNAP